jgi:hypothetical protein
MAPSKSPNVCTNQNAFREIKNAYRLCKSVMAEEECLTNYQCQWNKAVSRIVTGGGSSDANLNS